MPIDLSGWDPTGPNARNHWSGLSIDLHLALKAAIARLEREFDGVFDTATVQRTLYTSHGQFAADSAITRFLRAERFTRQQLRALARMAGHHTTSTPVVLFVSTRNAGRSSMATGFFQHLAEDRAIAWSGGSNPADELHPAAIVAMHECGIDITGEFPKPWTTETIQAADLVITMGCADTCPTYPGRRRLDWNIDDPARLNVDGIRPIRDDIERRVRELLEQLDIPTYR
jgi:arsenate reductase (thioredoxin)